jgi:general secretion pathway protein D
MPKRSVVVLLLALLPRLAGADAVLEKVPMASAAPGEDEALYSCKTKVGQVAVTFKPDTDLKDLMTWVMGFTCKNFLIDPRILATGKKITIMSPNKMSASEAYHLFLAALQTVGLTVVPKGNALKVVDSERAKHDTVPILRSPPDGSDQVVRYVLRPTYAQAETLKSAFTAIKSEAGDVTSIGSMVLITDYASHVRDMLQLAKLVDVPGGTEGIYTIPVKHADATKMSQMLTQIFGTTTTAPMPPPPAGAAAKPSDAVTEHPSKILVDERTNTIIVAATEPAYLRAKALVDRIDIANDIEGGGTIHVYQLTTAVAEDIAKTLQQALDGNSRTTTQKPPGAPGGPTAPGGPPAPAGPPQPAPPPNTGTAADALGAAVTGTVRVVADNKSNKLIIASSGRDFIAIRDVIRELDVPRRQVFIEMVVLEVQLKDGLHLGTSSHGTLPFPGGGIGIAGVQAPDLRSTSISSLASASGLVGGLLGPLKDTALGQSFPSYGVLFQAMQDHSLTNVIDTTSQIALDNEDSKYSVGENVPYSRGVLPVSPTGVTSQTVTNIDRKPLELQLTIKPHISAGDMVMLEVTHKSEDLTGRDAVLNEPIWATRNIETKTVVHDQQTVVLGGLIQHHEINTATKVPLLGDIPLLGHLFKYSTKTKTKTNLVILLTPYIIRDQLDMQLIRERKTREYEEFAQSFTELNAAKFEPHMDYRKKRGLVEEINQSLLTVQSDIEARKQFHEPITVQPGPVEVPKQ